MLDSFQNINPVVQALVATTITSRKLADLPRFNEAVIEALRG